MKNAALSVLVIAMSVSGVSLASEDGIEFGLTSGFYSKYLWRGHVITDDWVWQPDVSFSTNGFTAGIWANLNLTDEDPDYEGEFIEFDYYADYTLSLTDTVDVSLGYINYHFPQTTGDTYEFYAGVSVDTTLSPTLTWYYDADEVDGSYVALGIGHSVEEIAAFSEDVSMGLDIGLNVGWGDSSYNNAYWSVDDSGLNDLTLSFAFPVEMGDWTVTPSLNYMTLLDSDVRDSAGSDDEAFFTGISLATSF